jgi:hypothetical protein
MDQVANSLKSVRDMLHFQSDNQLYILAISGALTAVTLQAVSRFTDIILHWGNKARGLTWMRQKLVIRLLGAPLDVGAMLGVVLYILVAMFFVALVVFGILDPIISNRDLPEDKAKGNKLPNAGNNAAN